MADEIIQGKYLGIVSSSDKRDDGPPIRIVKRGEETDNCRMCRREEDVCDIIYETGEIERPYGTITGKTAYCKPCHKIKFPDKYISKDSQVKIKEIDTISEGLIKIVEVSTEGTDRTRTELSDCMI